MIMFYDFFARAEERGIDLRLAARGLLQNIRLQSAAGKIHGVRRVQRWLVPSSAQHQLKWLAQNQASELSYRLEDGVNLFADEKAALSAQLKALMPALELFEGYIEADRDPRLRPVPVTAWAGLGEPGSNMISRWPPIDPDDEEGIDEWTEIDWIAGHLTLIEDPLLDDETLRHEKVEYFALQIDERHAELILSNPDALLSTVPIDQLPKYTAKERREWIRKRGQSPGGQDQAYEEYRRLARHDGTKQADFRKECTDIWGRRVGRPRKP